MNGVTRLLSKTSIDPVSGCWNFTGFRLANGYGRIGGLGGRPRVMLAHRFSWLIHNGNIPAGLCVCHHCDNRGCVNPEHLFIGTHRENMRDMADKGRHPKPGPRPTTRGEAHWNTKLTLQQVKEIKSRSSEPRKTLAAEFGVKHDYISQILCGRKWSWV